MVHSVPGIDYPFHAQPLIQYTGPLLRNDSTQLSRLEPSLLEWLDASDLPVVYVSLGTVFGIDETTGPILFEGLVNQSEWRVLWALKAKEWQYLPSHEDSPNLRILPWYRRKSTDGKEGGQQGR